MHTFNLFDSVKLKTAISSETSIENTIISPETPGAIVEILDDNAYMVEFFGGWLKYDEDSALISAKPSEYGAFRETLDVSFVTSEQLVLLQPASETVGRKTQLFALIEQLPASLVAEVADFAEFLLEKQQRTSVAYS